MILDLNCIEIFCPTLTDPVDGSVSFSSVSVDSTATYSCNTGFELVGVAPRTCFAGTGEWSGMEPTCQSTRIRHSKNNQRDGLHMYIAS